MAEGIFSFLFSLAHLFMPGRVSLTRVFRLFSGRLLERTSVLSILRTSFRRSRRSHFDSQEVDKNTPFSS